MYESIEQLVSEEALNDTLLSAEAIQKHLLSEDDYRFSLSNGTWFHLQQQPVFGRILKPTTSTVT